MQVSDCGAIGDIMNSHQYVRPMLRCAALRSRHSILLLLVTQTQQKTQFVLRYEEERISTVEASTRNMHR